MKKNHIETLIENIKQGDEQQEALLKELLEAKQQAAATVALQKPTSFVRSSKLLVTISTIVLVTILALVTFNYFKPTPQIDEAAFTERIHDLATLATAEAYVKTVIEKEDNKLFGKEIGVNFPGTKRKLLLIVPAKVLAGVNLENIDVDDIVIDEVNKSLEITLPKATFISDPALDMEKIQAFSSEGLFRGDVNWEEGYDLAAEATKLLQQEALELGILETAEENASQVLREFFSALDYTVEIKFL
ncbi:DUF4230 domain-containing protein [Bacillus sp. HMF5848]|uniref:DUF4230 domain-containing protein n=1 Tax=Bacillus sp. HMF5848 TaxID=2495421 RepID=UPI000F7B9DED|nr:DUF4230 domain-containing protein [Bacillus sp. HMF5848]RSK26014.1 DUF4230 domain-containing protein [Bacillus sp. HMF5848]